MRCATIALLFVVGCSRQTSPDQENLLRVTGTVKYKGNPLPRAMVNFMPSGETKGVPASGQTREDGTYELTNVRKNKGAVPGAYKVTISRRVNPDGSDVPPDDMTPPIESKAKELLPPHFSNPELTTLQVVVKQGGEPYNFDLK